jgi:hypothetical protein
MTDASRRNATEFCPLHQYSSAVVSSLLPHVFVSENSILEIGFGSGRDLSFLKNKLNKTVYGIEASEQLQKKAVKLHPELSGFLFLGNLPNNIPDLPIHKFDGRLMILRPASRIKLLFERLGFEVTGTWESVDALGREGFRWVTIVFSYR